ncbi:hypothetical protein BSKO_13619 [Bryopsis sp. KO-2023]|nr:hypothetical protein BSKO_13619 [Bryopsis sp. KO-2023]
MQLRYWKNITPAQAHIHKVTALAWSPNNKTIAVVTEDLVVYLYDEQGEKRDKFKTKPADSAAPSYLIRSMAFAPDSTRLAIAQSDNIVFVYRLGAEWGDKKSICNKFQQSSSVTGLCWPKDRHNELVFGLADGKLKLGALKNNKPYNLYSHPEGSPIASLCTSPNGKVVVAGHQDGTIWRFNFPDEGGAAPGHLQITRHPCVPYALGCGEAIVATGNDNKVVFYDYNGLLLHEFDQGGDENLSDLAIASFNPAGDAVVLGGSDRFLVYGYKSSINQWEELGGKKVENMSSVTALTWKPDGGKLLLGTLTGGVDAFDVCIRRNRYKGKFEFTYVSRCSVIVKTLMTGTRIVLKSVYGYEIDKINVYQDRFLVARTPETLLVGDLETCKLSEIPWSNSTGGEKFHFENEKVCMIYCGGELSLVEYGRNEVLGSCRTEHISPFWVSSIFTEERGNSAESKRIAYLVDLQTVRILDLISGQPLGTISHDSKIDWLELNPRGTHILFRDKKRHLHVYDISLQHKATLLNFCQYVQWVPGSDVVVAQSRGNLCVWYSIRNPDQQTIYPIKGEVEDIERANNRTEVIVDEGINSASYALDESLIDFGSALEDQDFGRAIDILEPLELTSETEAQWRQLATVALQGGHIAVARRCCTAIGDIAKARYLRKVEALAVHLSQNEEGDGFQSYDVQAKLAVLNGDWTQAEQLLLAHGGVDAAVSMYTEAHRWQDAIRVAETHHHEEAESLKKSYYQWLLETGQEAEAGAVKEADGDYLAAISLYLKGCIPSKAAQVVTSSGGSYEPGLLDSICAALEKSGLHEKAGDLYEHLRRFEEAKEAFRRGHGYRKAVDLARHEFPGEVIQLEEEWGDWLMSQKQMDAAINHYIEAGQTRKAVEAALESRQFAKASGIIEFMDAGIARGYYKRIAEHYRQLHTYEEAERYFIKAGMAKEAVDMYSRAGRWEAAHKVAMGYLTDTEVHSLYTKRARELEVEGKFKEAEKLYLAVNEHDQAINMYKKQRMYDQMVHLVSLYRKDLLGDTHIHLAQKLESDGDLREAEKHYTAAEEWMRAVHMYRGANMWEDALRVAKNFGGADASRQVAYAWGMSLGGDEGAHLLKKLGLVDQAIDYGVESGAFSHAFQLARSCAKHKLPDIHLKYAMYLEDEGRFKEAEDEFINADKPREAIDMYLHNEDWEAGMAVAEQYDPTSISDILVAQAQTASRCKQFSLAESLYIKAKRPELALKMYRDSHCWRDALRVAEDYLPSKVQEIHLEVASNMNSYDDGGDEGAPDATMAKAKAFERGHDYARAIETYLSLTTDNCMNYDALQKLWENAVHVAMTHQRNRMNHVVATVSQRLISIDRFEAAAELHEGIDDVQGAVKCYCLGGMFDKARALAGGIPSLNKYVEERYNDHLLEHRNADELATRGHTSEALEMFCHRGEWEKVHELASQQGPAIALQYAAKHAKLKAKQQDFVAVASVLAEHGIDPHPGNFDMYKHVAKQILSFSEAERTEKAESNLATMLHRLLESFEVTATIVGAGEKQEFEHLYQAAHLLSLTNKAKDAGLTEIAAKQATSLLRFVDVLPADKAFYEAGMLWKSVGRLNMAFVLLNRYLDLVEAMEEGDGTVLENADFVDTDIPYDFELPEKDYVPEDQREEVRDWVLTISMDQQVDQTLSTRPCDRCGSDIYEASLVCQNCKVAWEACAVTGYPIRQGKKVTSQGDSGVVASIDDWNAWVAKFQTCPVTETAQTQQLHSS